MAGQWTAKFYDLSLTFIKSVEIFDASFSRRPSSVNQCTFSVRTDDDDTTADEVEILDEDANQLFSGRVSDRDITDTVTKYTIIGDLSLLERYQCPKDWRGWSGTNYLASNDLADIVKDCLLLFGTTKITTAAELTSEKSSDSQVDIASIYDNGEVFLDTYAHAGGLKYYANGNINFQIDMGADVLSTGRIVRWSETIGEYTHIKVRSKTAAAQGGLGAAAWNSYEEPLHIENAGVKDNEVYGVALKDSNRWVEIEFYLWTDEVAQEWDDGGTDMYGLTPVLHGFEVIWRETGPIAEGNIPGSVGEDVEGFEFSGISLLRAITDICEQHEWEFQAYYSAGAIKFDLGDGSTSEIGTDKSIGNADSVILKHGENAEITVNNVDIKGVFNAYHCYGKGEGRDQLYSYRSDATSITAYGLREATFEDKEITTLADLNTAGDAKVTETKDPITKYEVKTPVQVSFGDTITVVNPRTETVDDVRVLEEKRSYDSGGEVLNLGLESYVYNPFEAIVKIAESAYSPDLTIAVPYEFSAEVYYETVILRWNGDAVAYIVKFKLTADSDYQFAYTKEREFRHARPHPDESWDYAVAAVAENNVYSAWATAITVETDGQNQARDLTAAYEGGSFVHTDDIEITDSETEELFDYDIPDAMSTLGRIPTIDRLITYHPALHADGEANTAERKFAGRGVIGLWSATENLIDRGNCEDTEDPMIQTEAGASVGLAKCTFARDDTYHKELDYSFLMTHDGLGVADCTARLTDGAGVADMHGLTAGNKYVFSAWVYIPTTGGFTTGATLRVGESNGGAFSYTDVSTTTKDAWVRIENTVLLAGGTTGIVIVLQGDTASGAYVGYWDAIQLEDIDWATAFAPAEREVGNLRYKYPWAQTGTIEIWVKPNFPYTVGVAKYLISDYDSAWRIRLVYDSVTDKYTFEVDGAGGTATMVSTAATADSDIQEWTYIKIWWDIAGDDYGLVVRNSTYSDTITDSTTVGAVVFGKEMAVGSRDPGGATSLSLWDGWITDMLIRDTVVKAFPHYTANKPYFDPEGAYNYDRSWRMGRKYFRLHGVEISRSDDTGRLIEVGSAGIRARDTSHKIIHDIPNAPVLLNSIYGGHIQFKLDDTLVTLEDEDYTDVQANRTVSPGTTVDTDLSSYLPDGLTNVKGIVAVLRPYAYLDAAKDAANAQIEWQFYYSFVYSNPSAGNIVPVQEEIVMCRAALAVIYQYRTSSQVVIPIVYDSGTPYITTRLDVTWSNLSANNARYRLLYQMYVVGFLV